MKVLLIGSGGREHALAWKLAQSPLLTEFYAAPGNPGIAEHATLVAVNTEDNDAVAAFCRDKEIDFVAVGPEAPLVAGLADAGTPVVPRSWTKAIAAQPRIDASALLRAVKRAARSLQGGAA